MRHARSTLILAAAFVAALPALAQTPPATVPGAPDVARVAAGTYTVEPNHTQVVWSVNHLGFTMLTGIFASSTGTMTLDPKHPGAAVVAIDFPLAKVTTTREAFTTHLLTAELLDVGAHPVASFRSNRVVVTGKTAKIFGNLTLRGITKSVVLDARFMGAGINPNSKKPTIGFEATASIKRSDYGIVYVLPNVADRVDLQIHAAFERADK